MLTMIGAIALRRHATAFIVKTTTTTTTSSPHCCRALATTVHYAVKSHTLSADEVRWTCDPHQFDFKTTAELEDLEGLLGQARAEKAIEFGVNMRRDGYNLYVLGPSGSGKRTVIRNYLGKRAKSEPQPSDWCYVNNFDSSDKPKSFELPAGMGRQLQQDMKKLAENLQISIPATLESEEHRQLLQSTEKKCFEEHEKAVEQLAAEARKSNVTMIQTPNGVVLAGPADGDENSLTMEEKEKIHEAVMALQPKLREIAQRYPQLKKQATEKSKELNKEAARQCIEVSIYPLKKFYANQTDVIAHLDAVEADIVENSEQIRSPDDDIPLVTMMQGGKPRLSFDRYLVNLLVDNSETEGAPVVYEDHPYYHNLVGRIEYQSSLGAFVTNFAMIKPGSLHRANGGYLVVHARDLLLQPFAWEAMKRCLRSGEVRMQSLGAEMNLISTVSLQPEPISLDVKVVLLGDRLLYYLLQAYDPDFDELFKVEADFNDDMDRSKESCQLYARMLATLGKAESSRPMNAEAVAAMIEEAARQVGDQEKLSTHIRSCADLYRESDYWASTDNGSEVIEARHVHKAIDEQVYRSDRIRELIREQIRRGTLMVDVDGKRIGQVNGLSVMQIGHLAFGRPSRITATVRLGRGKVVDIEREVELGGPTHSKGVMILSSVLASRYAKDCPLSLSASLVFEQSYGSVDGDSASMAELCALLSALAELPIRQDLAITGSLNQLAEAQPIGGATEKIEGFFDICSAKGLTGDQGVLIPASNAKHLMLRQEVVEAVDQGKFHVFTYKNVDEAISILTGVEAGERATADGKYPADTVNFLVDKRLHEMSDLLRNYTESLEKNEK